MGSNIGKNAGTTAVYSLKPNLEKMDAKIEKGIQEISEFKQSLNKNVDSFLNKIDTLFNELNSLADDTLFHLDSLIQNYMNQMIILIQTIIICVFIFKFCIIQLKNQNNSLISSIISMKHFAIMVILFLSIQLKFIYDGKTEIYPTTIPFWLWSVFVLTIVFLDWLITTDNNKIQPRQYSKMTTSSIILLAFGFMFAVFAIINKLREKYGN